MALTQGVHLIVPRVKLTKRSAERTSAPGCYWDQTLPGFGLRVYPSGKKAWIVQYQPRGGRQRRIALGPFPPVLLEKAKREALAAELEAHEGRGPRIEIRTLDGKLIAPGTPVGDLTMPGGLAELAIHPDAELPPAKSA